MALETIHSTNAEYRTMLPFILFYFISVNDMYVGMIPILLHSYACVM